MKIIIPLCGRGERFRASYTEPKPLVKVAGKEIISYALDGVAASPAVESIHLIVNNRTCAEVAHFIAAKYPRVEIVNIDGETRGAAETILLGLRKMTIRGDDDVLILDGDSYYKCDIARLVKDTMKGSDECAVVYMKDTGSLAQYSYIALAGGSSGIIEDIQEKVKISDNANTGAYYFRRADEVMSWANYIINEGLKSAGEFYVSTLIAAMMSAGARTFRGVEIGRGDFVSLGTPELVRAALQTQPVAAYLFDLDGTLVNTDEIYLKVWHQLLKEYKIHVTDEFYRQYIHGNDDKSVWGLLFEGARDGPTLDELRTRKNELFVEHIADIEEIGGAVEFIRGLKGRSHDRNVWVAIVTNSNRVVAEKILDYIGLGGYIDYLCIGCECKEAKPSPEPYLCAIRVAAAAAAGAPERIYIFEDSKSGLLSARNAGPTCIVGVGGSSGSSGSSSGSSSTTDEAVLREYGANIVISEYTDDLIVTLEAYVPPVTNHQTAIEDNITRSLSKTHDISSVEIDSRCLKGGYINDVVRCRLVDRRLGKLNTICKLENVGAVKNSLCEMAHKIELYDREYFFYEVIYPYVNIRVPRYIGTIRDSATMKRRGIVLEDVGEHVLNPDMNKMAIDDVLVVVDTLAKFHAQFMGVDVCREFRGLYTAADAPYRTFMVEFMQANVEEFISRWSFMMDDNVIRAIRGAVAGYDELHKAMSEGVLTLCHGDFKAPNMFWDRDAREVIMIDWQYVAAGKGAQDLVFFMIESLNVERFRELWSMLVGYYYEKVRESAATGAAVPAREEFMGDVRRAVLYFPLFVAVWFGVTDAEHLLDKNFPFFFIKKLVNAIRICGAAA